MVLKNQGDLPLPDSSNPIGLPSGSKFMRGPRKAGASEEPQAILGNRAARRKAKKMKGAPIKLIPAPPPIRVEHEEVPDELAATSPAATPRVVNQPAPAKPGSGPAAPPPKKAQTAAAQAPASRPATRESVPAGKSAPVKQTASKKPVAKKAAVAKSGVKQAASKKAAPKKAASKKTAAKKAAAKKSAVKKSAVKKTAVKKTAVRKPAAKKPPARKTGKRR